MESSSSPRLLMSLLQQVSWWFKVDSRVTKFHDSWPIFEFLGYQLEHGPSPEMSDLLITYLKTPLTSVGRSLPGENQLKTSIPFIDFDRSQSVK